VVVLGILLGTVSLQTAPAQASGPRDCGPRAAKTIDRNRLVRVYATQRMRTLGHVPAKHYFACGRSGGKRTALGTTVRRLVLRGRYLNYVDGGCAGADCSFVLEVLDALNGRVVAGSGRVAGTDLEIVATARAESAVLVATPDGAERYIVRADLQGTSELDRGPAVGDLTLKGSRLHWLNGDRRRSAPIAHQRRCGRTTGVVNVSLQRNVRIYSVYRQRDGGDEEFADYYGCLRPGGRPVKLTRVDVTYHPGSAGSTESPGVFVSAGRFVAFAQTGCAFTGCTSTLVVFDMRARRRTRSAHIRGSATVVLAPSGLAAALVSFEESDSYPGDSSVVRIDPSGAFELDRGPDVRDLTIDGDVLHWLNDGEPRSAGLRP